MPRVVRGYVVVASSRNPGQWSTSRRANEWFICSTSHSFADILSLQKGKRCSMRGRTTARASGLYGKLLLTYGRIAAGSHNHDYANFS